MLAHQYGGDLCQWVPYASRLASLGYTALAFDLRGFGRSQKRYGDALIRYDRDVVAAAKLARGLGARKVIVVGASLGANAVVVAGRGDHAARRRSRQPLGPRHLPAGRDRGRQAALRAGAVRGRRGGRGRDLRDRREVDVRRRPGTDKQLVIVPGAKHGVALVAGPGKVRSAVERFIAAHAG